ncbi:MAG: hypothetical protein LBP33_09360 [Candidatus Adiutrix sp.]|jgi:Ca2+-binding EF-hand superfamily protein|nr:hypothetical protein [Candidatus Adiutrix sp.]
MSISALSNSTSSYWQERINASKAKGAEQPQDDLATKLFTDLDIDGDEGISLAESGLDQETYDSMDTDKDGAVSFSELQAALEFQQSAILGQIQFKQQSGEAPPPPDGEQSEQLNTQEILASIMSGTMPMGPPQDGAAAEGVDDAGDSGGVSVAGSGQGQSEYDEMDSNKDGVVSAQELAAALGQFSPFSSRLSANNSAQTGQTTDSGSKLSQNWLSELAARLYSSSANYSISNLTQGLSFSA